MIRTSRAGDVAKQIKRSTCIDGIRIALEDYFLTEKYSSAHSQGTLPVCAAASRLVRLSGSPDEAFRLLVDVWRPSNVYLLERLGLSSRPFLESFKKMGIPGKPLVTRHAIPLLELLQGVKQGSGSTHNQRFSNLALTLALSVKGGPTAGLATALLHCWAVWGPPSSDVVAALDKGGAASPYEPTKIPLVGGSPGVLESFVAAAEPPLPSQPLANPKMWVEAISLMNKFQPPRAEGARVALWLARGGSPVGDPSLTPRGHGRSKLTASEAALSFIGAPIKYDAFHSAERQKKKVFSGALLAGVTSTEKINSLGNVAADPTTLGALSNAERPTLSPQIMRIRDWAAVFSDTLTKKMLQQRGTHDKDGHHENTPSPAEECSIKNKEIMPESALALLSPTHFHPLVDIPCDMSPSARASAAFLRRMHGITFGVLGMKGLPTGGSLPPNSRQGLKSVLGSSGSLREGTPPPPQKLVTGATLSAILRSAKCPGDVAYVLNLADWLELPLTSGGLLQESVAKLCGWGRSSEAMDLIARMRAEEEEAAAFSRVSDTFTPSRALLEAVSAVIQVCSEAGADAQALSAWAYLCQAAEGGGWRPTPGAVAAAINSSSRCGLVEDMYRCIVWVESGRGYISCDSDSGSGSDLIPSKGYRLGDLTRAIAATQSPVGASAGYSAQRVPPSAPSIAALADATLAVVSLIEEGMGAAVSKVGDTSGIPSLLSAIPGLPLDERAAASMSGEQPTLPFPPGSYLLPSHRLSPLQWGATTQKGKTTRSGLEQPSLPFVASLLALARCGDGDYVVLLVLRELGRRAAAVERERGRGGSAMAGRGGHEKEEGEEAAVNGAFVRALAMVGDVEGAFSAARAFVRLHAGASPPRGTTLRTRGGKEGARSTAVPYMDLLSVLSAASHLHHLPPVYGVLGLIQEMERERGASDDERVEGPTENDSGGYESRRFRWALPRALLKMSRRIVRVRREEERQKGVQGLMSKGWGALEEEEEEREGAMLLQQARAILGNFAVGEVGKAGDDIEINGEKTGMPRREEEDEFLHDYKMEEEEEEEEEEGGGVGKGGSDFKGIGERSNHGECVPNSATSSSQHNRKRRLTDAQVAYHLLATVVVKWTCQLLGCGDGVRGDFSAKDARKLALASAEASIRSLGAVGGLGLDVGSSRVALNSFTPHHADDVEDAGGHPDAPVTFFEPPVIGNEMNASFTATREAAAAAVPLNLACDALTLLVSQWPLTDILPKTPSRSSTNLTHALPAHERGAMERARLFKKTLRAHQLSPPKAPSSPRAATMPNSPPTYLDTLLKNSLTYSEYLGKVSRRGTATLNTILAASQGGDARSPTRRVLPKAFGPPKFHKDVLGDLVGLDYKLDAPVYRRRSN